MPKEVMSLKGAKKSFGDKEVLKGVDLSLNSSQVLAIIGESGVGKSTLARCLALLDEFDSGFLSYGESIVCEDRQGKCVYRSQQELKEVRSKVGFVFQNFNLFPHFTVEENIIKPLKTVKKLSSQEAKEIARKRLEEEELLDFANMVPCDLSGGQKQRVAIARALALNPDVIFFDEPTSALDPKLSSSVAALIRKIAKGGVGVVVITHDMNFARDAADEVAVLSGGVFVERGQSEQVLSDPKSEITKQLLTSLH